MQVTVTFLGTLREQVGNRSLTVELPTIATYRDLLDAIAPTMEEKLTAGTWDPTKRSFSRQMTVTLNRSADLRDDTRSLGDGDEILVFLPMAGG